MLTVVAVCRPWSLEWVDLTKIVSKMDPNDVFWKLFFRKIAKPRTLDFEQHSNGFAIFLRFHPPKKAPETIQKHDCETTLETAQQKHAFFWKMFKK